MTIDKRLPEVNEDAGILALKALAWVLGDGVRAQRFLDLTGLSPEGLRHAAGFQATQKAVLDFLCAHEPDLIAAAEALEVEPTTLAAARERLAK